MYTRGILESRLHALHSAAASLDELLHRALLAIAANVGIDLARPVDDLRQDRGQRVYTLRLICVEDILRRLYARARAVPDLCFLVLGAYKEVECVFNVGLALLFSTCELVLGGLTVRVEVKDQTYR